jgi:PAS domain S-box-containing protein
MTISARLDSQLLDAAPDAMVVVDAAGGIVLINRQAESLFGYSRDELIGQKVEVLLPERFRENHPAHRQQFSDEPRFRREGVSISETILF